MKTTPEADRQSWRDRAHRWRRTLLSLAAVVIVFIIALAYWWAWANSDPWKTYCTESADNLPAAIPQRLIIDVVDEDRERLEGPNRLAIERSLDDALVVYSFSDRVFPRFEPDDVEVREGSHLMELRVYFRSSIPNPPIRPAAGRMCGNVVLVEHSPEPEVTTLRIIHELGHFFELCHEQGTYMRTDVLRPDPEQDRFNGRQLGILEEWHHPGTTYVRHWFRCP